MEIKKVVLQLEIHDDRDKKKALKIVSSVPGVESLSIDMKDQKLTVIGDVDPVCLTKKLRKYCHTKIFTVGPAKEPEKKKEEPKKKEEDKKPDGVHQIVMPYNPYVSHAYCHNPGYYARVEEDPYGCVIC